VYEGLIGVAEVFLNSLIDMISSNIYFHFVSFHLADFSCLFTDKHADRGPTFSARLSGPKKMQERSKPDNVVTFLLWTAYQTDLILDIFCID
jgi:hypothetical protein